MSSTKTSMADTAEIALKVGQLETEVSGIKSDLGGIKAAQDSNFARIFDRLEKQNNRPTPWSVIISALAAFLTLATAIALWANSYFGQAINAANREAARAYEHIMELRAEQKQFHEWRTQEAVDLAILHERVEQGRKSIDTIEAWRHSGGHVSPSLPSFRSN